MIDFGKYSFEILISYLGTFSLILILIITTYLDSKRVKKNLDKLTNDNLNDSK
ncbi:MAG: heme exporter protein CcmD [Paracoccaceae bacterium]|tara:strand:+ start:117 stop:275 length:159 start_codon:yes stop_codon:yes gene_type:complete